MEPDWWATETNTTYNPYADGDSWGSAFQDQSWIEPYMGSNYNTAFNANMFPIPTANYDNIVSGGWDHSMNLTPTNRFSQQPMGGGIGGGFVPNQQPIGWAQDLSNPQTLLGLVGGIAGLIGAITGGGVKQTTEPQMGKAQRTQLQNANSANQRLVPMMKGQTPLQQQQMQLLQAITSGQGLDQNYAQAVEGAFEPQMGNLYEQATLAGRKRGFHDSPATSPAGGAVLGPGLADLQGQIAQAKINMMMGLPGLFQNPINQQGQMAQAFAQGNNSLFGQMQTGSQVSQPLGPTIGQGIGQGLLGFGQGMAQNQQMNQQNMFNNAMMQMLQRQSTPYEFGGYSGQ